MNRKTKEKSDEQEEIAFQVVAVSGAFCLSGSLSGMPVPD
jgi:hypothetical protein